MILKEEYLDVKRLSALYLWYKNLISVYFKCSINCHYYFPYVFFQYSNINFINMLCGYHTSISIHQLALQTFWQTISNSFADTLSFVWQHKNFARIFHIYIFHIVMMILITRWYVRTNYNNTCSESLNCAIGSIAIIYIYIWYHTLCV